MIFWSLLKRCYVEIELYHLYLSYCFRTIEVLSIAFEYLKMFHTIIPPKPKAVCPWVTMDSSILVCYLINILPRLNIMTKK